MDLQLIKFNTHKEKIKKKLSPLQNSMEIKTKTENKNKEQRKNKLGLMSFIKCIPKAKKNKRKFTFFHPQIGSKNKTSFVQKRATNNLQLFNKTNYDNPTKTVEEKEPTSTETKPLLVTKKPAKKKKRKVGKRRKGKKR